MPAFRVRDHVQEANELSRTEIAGMRKAHLEIIFPAADFSERRHRISRMPHSLLQIGIIRP